MALALYKEGKTLGLKGELRDQFDRASLSVVLNLAEGSGKIGKDRMRFFGRQWDRFEKCKRVLKSSNTHSVKKQIKLRDVCIA